MSDSEQQHSHPATTTSTGYGPSMYRSSSRRPEFDGNGEKYELFESKLLGHMRRLQMHKIILPEHEGGVQTVDAEDNAEVYAELIQCLLCTVKALSISPFLSDTHGPCTICNECALKNNVLTK